MAALTIGSGMGAHYAQEYAPWVASAGVLSMALLSRQSYRQDLGRLSGEVTQLHLQMANLSRQMEEDRRKTQSGLATMSTISHEIRSPLSAVIALGDMLDKAELTGEHRHMVRDLVDAGRMVMHVVNDSLDYAKAEAVTASSRPQPFSVAAVVERAQRQAAILAGSKPGLRVQSAACPVDWVSGEEAYVQQVLTNLCANAVKFSEKGVVRISTEVRGSSEDDRLLDLMVKVQDCGPGLSRQQCALLFKPYYRGDADSASRAGGTGLGLYLSQRLVEMMGGTIGVNSEPGRGCEFWFSVPVRRAEGPAAREAPDLARGKVGDMRHEAKGDQAARPLKGLVIGVVDDARINREVTRRIIEAHGGRCVMLDSGEALMREVQADRLVVDILLLDIEMPGMGGLAAAAQLRGLPKWAELPIVAVSAVATEDIGASLRNKDLSGFLPKPFHAHGLVQKILAYRP